MKSPMNRSLAALYALAKWPLLGGVLVSGCVEHRPIRNGLDDQSIYLEKAALTRPNPKLGAESADDGWLYKVTVVEASSPNVVGDYAFLASRARPTTCASASRRTRCSSWMVTSCKAMTPQIRTTTSPPAPKG